VAWFSTSKRPLQAPNGELFVLGPSVVLMELMRRFETWR
jgi:hypothetical protein